MKYLIEELEELLTNVPEGSQASWGNDICKLSRRLHIRVWQERPSQELTRQLKELLVQAVAMMERTAECRLYVQNVNVRIKSIDQYLADGMPLLPEDANIDEAMLGEEYQQLSQMYPSACV